MGEKQRKVCINFSIFNLKTEKSFVFSCRVVDLTLEHGTWKHFNSMQRK